MNDTTDIMPNKICPKCGKPYKGFTHVCQPKIITEEVDKFKKDINDVIRKGRRRLVKSEVLR